MVIQIATPAVVVKQRKIGGLLRENRSAAHGIAVNANRTPALRFESDLRAQPNAIAEFRL
jgi:hypothetical protein